ncbi:hypothetical protein J3F83DRAFT_759935 [Trichoderma novae-zelandiae]
MVEILDDNLPRRLQGRASRPPILQLPQELAHLICSFLTPAWLVSLALTCKSMRRLVLSLGAMLERLDVEGRGVLLYTLQKDLPGTYFCFCCYKIRHLEPSAGWNEQPHKWMPGPYHPRSWWLSEQSNIWHVPTPYHYPTFKSRFCIDFMEAYLIMNAHFLGPSHGIPLKSLERYVSFQDKIELNICQPSGSHGGHPGDHQRSRQGLVGICEQLSDEIPRLATLWRFSHQTVPRIVDDKLYVARFYRISGPLVPWQCLARLISSLEPEVCRHLWCSAGSTPPFCNLLPIARQPSDLPRSLPGNGLYMVPMCISPESDSCRICNTDYDISVRQDKHNHEWVFSLSAYHCLGSCRTPIDDFWDWFVHDMPGRSRDVGGRQFERSRRVAKLGRFVGTARRNWVEGAHGPLVQRGGREQTFRF